VIWEEKLLDQNQFKNFIRSVPLPWMDDGLFTVFVGYFASLKWVTGACVCVSSSLYHICTNKLKNEYIA
jgi:hypothetical protein